MAEIRIPTDRIPADILLRLRAIGRSVSNISMPSSSTSSPPPSTSSSSSCPLSTSISSLSTTPVAASSSPSISSSSSVAVLTTSERGSCQLAMSTSPKKMSDPTDDSHHIIDFSSHVTRTPRKANVSASDFYADEVDGGEGIVHAFHEPDQHNRVTDMCYDVMDNSGIVRVFPEEVTKPKPRQTIGSHFPSDESDIVRIFPEISDEGEGMHDRKGTQTSKRSDIVRALTPTKNIQTTSSLNFQIVEDESPRKRSPRYPDDQCVNASELNTETRTTSSPKQRKAFSPENENSIYTHLMTSENSPYKLNNINFHNNKISTTSTPEKTLNTWCLPSIIRPDNYNTKNMINKNNNSELQTAITKSQDMKVKEISPSKRLPSNIRREQTPVKYARQSPTIPGQSPTTPGHSRRSPELPTPPETPDGAEAEDDEVFSYENVISTNDVITECCDIDALRQSLESTPRRDNVHARNNSERRSPSLRGSSCKRTSPFSPAQRQTEISMGDRQQTRKRLSFDEDTTCYDAGQTQLVSGSGSHRGPDHNFPPTVSQLEMRTDSPSPSRFYNTDQTFTSPKCSYQSPSGSPSRISSSYSTGQNPVTSVAAHVKAVTSLPSSFYSCTTSPYPTQSSNPQINDQRQMGPYSYHHYSMQSPVQETINMVGRVLARHCQEQNIYPPRLRIHSDGDDVTDGQLWHSKAHTQDSDLAVGRPRGQTFSGYRKRRRMESSEQDDSVEFSLQTSSNVETNTFLLPQPTTSSAAFTSSISAASSVPSSSQKSPTPTKTSDQMEEELTDSCACVCETIERNFLKMAEKAYKRIRRLDAPPNDFERFRQELAKTNDILRESMAVVKNIKAMCGHVKEPGRSSKDQQ